MPNSSLSTSVSLLRRVCEQDATSWERLVHIYGPLVYRWCRQQGIKQQDASDIMQDVFSAVSISVNRFEHEEGQRSFRGWLYGVTRFKILDHHRDAKKHPQAVAGDVLEATIAVDPASASYSSAPESGGGDLDVIVGRTLNTIRHEYTNVTWKAFWRTAVDNQTASEVAKELDLQAANVRQIKFRILKRLRTELEGLEPEL